MPAPNYCVIKTDVTSSEEWSVRVNAENETHALHKALTWRWVKDLLSGGPFKFKVVSLEPESVVPAMPAVPAVPTDPRATAQTTVKETPHEWLQRWVNMTFEQRVAESQLVPDYEWLNSNESRTKPTANSIIEHGRWIDYTRACECGEGGYPQPCPRHDPGRIGS